MITPAILALALAASPVPIQEGAVPAAFEPAPLEVGLATFHRRVLPNGLQALVVDTPHPTDAARTSVFMVVGVGSGAEGASQSGLAHLVEHALFTGTAATGTDAHEAQLVQWGAESNAYTRDDYTVYYDHGFDRAHLSVVLGMEADRLRGLTWDRDAFLHERYRLDREERGAFTESDGRRELLEAAVLGGRPYAAGVRDAEGRTLAPQLAVDAARAFYDQWYHPRNTAVVVAGRVDPAETLDAIEAAFGALPAGPPPPAMPGGTSARRGGEVRYASSLPEEKRYAAWVGPALWTSDRAALTLAAEVLATRHRGAGHDVWMGGRRHADLFVLGAAGVDAPDVLNALAEELRDDPVTDTELAAAAADLGDDLATIPVHGRPYFSLAATVGIHAVLGDATWPARAGEAFAKVTPADVSAAVERWLDPALCMWVVFEADPDADPDAPEYTLPADPGELAGFAQDAADAGNLDAAIAAYEQLLTMGPDRMNAVIYRYYIGTLKREVGDLEGALAALEEALEIVDYPDVRDLANEIRAELESATPDQPLDQVEDEPMDEVGAAPGSTGDTAMGDGANADDPTPPVASHGVTLVGDLAPEGEAAPAFTGEAAAIMAELELWRERDFTQDLVVEFVLAADAPAEKLNGWYEPDTGRLVVIENDNQAMGRGTLLHEMFHALQDQAFDLTALDARAASAPAPDDAFRAVRALVEGEAMLAVSDLMDYDFEQHTDLPEAGPLDEARFAKIFHYGAGLRFVRHLYGEGGWELVDAAYAHPPLSTTQIMHPDRYLAGVAPHDLAGRFDAPGCECGAPDHDAQVIGEYGLALFLARPESTRAASERVAGRLAGDLLHTVHAPDGSERYVWYLSFYDALAAEEFTSLATDRLGLEAWALDDSGRNVGVRLVDDPVPVE